MAERRAEQSWVDYVTMMIGDQLLGLPITRVRDVFVPGRVTPVPLSPPEVAGILNLRGRIVTAIDVRLRLDLSRRPAGWPVIAIGIEQDRECYVLLFDAVGEVMSSMPATASRCRRTSAAGWRGWRAACIGWRASFSSCSTSTGFWLWMKTRSPPDNCGLAPETCGGLGVKAMKICLVVDDSSVIRKVARRILEGMEFQIVEAEDGEQALVACQRRQPDAVLHDWNMPRMHGYDVLNPLRRLPGGDRPKVVFCTTENDVAHIARALHAGAPTNTS
jgi:two-component system chemotaxis response regulator CheY